MGSRTARFLVIASGTTLYLNYVSLAYKQDFPLFVVVVIDVFSELHKR